MQSPLLDPTGDETNLSRLKGKFIHIETFGCTFNRVDSLRLATGLQAYGSRLVSADDADLIIVNTCTVIGQTERRVLRYLRAHREKELYVMGCMVSVQKGRILSVCSPRFLSSRAVRSIHPAPGTHMGGAIGTIQIAEGCEGECTYCAARIARGPLSSHPADQIRSTFHRLVTEGAREIQLSAMDVAAWGLDRGETLIALLDELDRVPGECLLRLGMMNPASLSPILDALIPRLKRERMYRFLHLPIQSGSDAILHAMRRTYTADHVLHMVRRIRDELPDLWLATDVIAGFPGETEDDFQKTLELLRAISPNKVNITRYSPRPDTPARYLPDILERTKKERSRRLTALATRICRNENAPWLDRVVPAWASERLRAGSTVCRNRAYRSIVVMEELPMDWKGQVQILEDRVHYFTGKVQE